MSTEANPTALQKQAETLREAAKLLEPKIADGNLPTPDREALFAQFQALHSQAFALTTNAAAGIVTQLAVDVAQLQAQIDKAKDTLATIQSVKDGIALAASLVQMGAAVATGQPVAIAQAFGALQQQLNKVT